MSCLSSLPDLADPCASLPPEPDVTNAGHIIGEPPDPDGPVG